MAYIGGSSTTSSPTSSFYIQDLGTAAFYGLHFIDSIDELVTQDQNLVSKPAVLIEGTDILLDYSDSASETDKQYLDVLFGSMNSSGGTFSTGFTLTNAIYNDNINSYSADLSASVTLSNYTNYKVLGKFSAIGSTIETNFYQPEYFDTIPQISSAVGLTGATLANKILLNFTTSDSTSFVGNDIQRGDYLDFDTAENIGRYTVQGISLDGLSRERIEFSTADRKNISLENLKGTEVILAHSRRVFDALSPTLQQQQNTVIHIVGFELVDGKKTITIDGVLNKSLILSRGQMYLFVVDQQDQIAFKFTDQSVTSGSEYIDVGLYTIGDVTLNKKYFFFIPNNTTPSQLFYTSSLDSVNGIGGIKISGGFDYVFGAQYYNNLGTGGNTSNVATATYGGSNFYGGIYG